jgi:hypothetical protein
MAYLPFFNGFHRTFFFFLALKTTVLLFRRAHSLVQRLISMERARKYIIYMHIELVRVLLLGNFCFVYSRLSTI